MCGARGFFIGAPGPAFQSELNFVKLVGSECAIDAEGSRRVGGSLPTSSLPCLPHTLSPVRLRSFPSAPALSYHGSSPSSSPPTSAGQSLTTANTEWAAHPIICA